MNHTDLADYSSTITSIDGYHRNIIDELVHQRETGAFCDVILVWAGNRYFAHRSVLAASSKFFADTLNGLRFSRETINLDLPSGEYLEDLISYLYTGEAKISDNNIGEMILFSQSFDLAPLMSMCEQFMVDNVSLNNCLTFKLIIDNHNLQSIYHQICDFINDNYEAIFTSGKFLEQSSKILKKLFTDPNLEVNSPGNIFAKLQYLFSWLNHNHKMLRERSLKDLLRTFKVTDPSVFLIAVSELNPPLTCKSCLKTIKSFLLVKFQSKLTDLDEWNLFLDAHDLRDPVIAPIANELEVKNIVVELVQTMVGIISEQEESFDTPMDLSYQSFLNESTSQDTPVGTLKRRRKSIPRKFKLKKEQLEYDDDGSEDGPAIPRQAMKLRLSANRQQRRTPRARTSITPCPECDYKALNPEKLEKHYKRKHETPSLLVCNVCSSTYETYPLLYTHLKEHYSGPPYLCNESGCTFDCEEVEKLWKHWVSGHSAEAKPYQCITCNTRFKQKCHLTIHMRVHSGEKPFVCQICDRKFTQKGSLDIHQAVHTDDRPFLCDTCGFATKYKSHFMIHKKIHTGEVYRCTQCDYFTPKRQLLAAHMRYHLSIRSFICAQCGRAFFEKSHLVRHERIHLSEKPFSCAECDYCTTRRDKLKEHSKKYHSGDEMTPQRTPRPRAPRRDTAQRRSKLAPPTAAPDAHASVADTPSLPQPTQLQMTPNLLSSAGAPGTPSTSSVNVIQSPIAVPQKPAPQQQFYPTGQPTFFHQQIDANGQMQLFELPAHMMVAVTQPNVHQQAPPVPALEQHSQQPNQTFTAVRPPNQQMVAPSAYPTLMQSELGLGALMQQLFTSS